ncbi:MAG: hypothetical protein AAGA37_00235 [Actinomycetota bacterium]
MRRPVSLFVAVVLALVAAACGGATDDTASTGNDGDEGTTTTTVASTTTTAATAETTTTAAAATTTSTTTAPETTTTTTTTVPSAVTLPTVATAELPDLVVAWGNETGAPLDLAQRLIGFPLDIAPPGSTTPAAVDLRLRVADDGAWRWEWSYSAFAAAGTVQDIDTELPEGGPGTIEGRLHYDPLFEALGWRNVGQVISDPSSGGGGPQSVNWAYSFNGENLQIGGIATQPTSARAWVDEDIGFNETEGNPGHRVDINAEVSSGSIPTPLIASLLSNLPTVDGELIALSLRSFTRSPDSFNADEGLRYLVLSVEWQLNSADPEAAGARYLSALSNSVLQEGDESFFDEGVIEVRPPSVGGSRDWQQSVVLLDRYLGTISMDQGDNGAVIAELDIDLEPNREILTLPES